MTNISQLFNLVEIEDVFTIPPVPKYANDLRSMGYFNDYWQPKPVEDVLVPQSEPEE